MGKQTKLKITMTLCSDAQFGSGDNLPGIGERGVCRDASGYPYLMGSTLKGLLRESASNYLLWTGESEDILDELFGAPGDNSIDDRRRVRVTSLTLDDPPEDPADCFGRRTFIELEDSVRAHGMLHRALCVRSGLRFSGFVFCDPDDESLLTNSLRCIKWVGTRRSRGFGSVSISVERAPEERLVFPSNPPRAGILRYRLRSELPLLFTDPNHSFDNFIETRTEIPGTAVRGMVLSALANNDPAWFEQNKEELLSERTRFFDALPNETELPVLPAIHGFYEDKRERNFQTVLRSGDLTVGVKRAKLGDFCAIDDSELLCWSAETDSVVRMDRSEQLVFQVQHLCAGQAFDGYIQIPSDEIAERIAAVFCKPIWIGGDRYSGFGLCRTESLEFTKEPAWAQYGYSKENQPGKTLYLLSLSPLTMQNEAGESCGLNLETLAQKLDVSEIKLELCSTSVSEYGGYNRVWGCRENALRMYDRGSIFRLTCSEAPSLERIRSLQKEGLGVRRAQGCGQVLFLRSELFEAIQTKRMVKRNAEESAQTRAVVRRAKLRWVMAQKNWQGALSRSQLGLLQSLCEKALVQHGDLTQLQNYLDYQEKNRETAAGQQSQKALLFVRRVLETPLSETIGAPCADSVCARVRLLCLLFDFTRKRRGKEGE